MAGPGAERRQITGEGLRRKSHSLLHLLGGPIFSQTLHEILRMSWSFQALSGKTQKVDLLVYQMRVQCCPGNAIELQSFLQGGVSPLLQLNPGWILPGCGRTWRLLS